MKALSLWLLMAVLFLWSFAYDSYGMTLTEIHGFELYDTVNGYNSQSALVQGSDGYLFGTTSGGGANSEGTTFYISTNGSPFGTLASFSLYNGGYIGGGYIAGPIIGVDGNLYGTTLNGGASLDGEVYQETGSGINILYSFDAIDDIADGYQPYAGLVQGVDGSFYGTTTVGGEWTFLDPNNIGYGTIFQITTNSILTTLHSFSGDDGFDPQANLVQGKDGNLYGTTSYGGTYDSGIVFKIKTDGTGFTNLYSFTGGNDGSLPFSGLIQGNDGNFYGTTEYRGAYTYLDSSGNGYGTIFKITTNGILTTLASFNNKNGANPNSALVEATDGNFYGTTVDGLTDYPIGGIPNWLQNFGTVYQMTPAGLVSIMISFDYEDGYGADPNGLMQANDGNLYGTCQNGGTYFGASGGTVFYLTLSPSAPLIIMQPLGLTNAVGTIATFTVSASGAGPLYYQWRKSNVNIAGATSASYSLINVQTNQEGVYSVVITNVAGHVTSSNVTLTVIRPPTLTITSPKTGAKTSNDVFSVTGTASDKIAVANVLYSLNDGAWTSASPDNVNWSTWSISVDLTPGTNTLSIYAVDSIGLYSITNTLNLIRIATATLAVGIHGDGTIKKDYNGDKLVIGESYAMTAKANKGFGFEKWTDDLDDLLTTNTALEFDMAANMAFEAWFVDVEKPTLSITSPKKNTKITGTTVTVMGKTTDNVGVAGVWYQFNNGGWQEASGPVGFATWTVADLSVVSGVNTVEAYAKDAAGNISATNTVMFSDTP